VLETVRTVFPTPFPLSANSMAGANSSKPKVRPTGGVSDPSSTHCSSSLSCESARSASNSTNWRTSTPARAAPFMRVRLTGRAGIGPPAKPTTRCRPRQLSERNASSNSGPQTGSKTTSGPVPPQAVLRRSRHPSASVSITTSAPLARAKDRFSSVEAAAMTVAPRRLPTCTAAMPTPPAAPSTRRRSPGCSWPRSRKPCSAVR
jgi:hypothetical protein